MSPVEAAKDRGLERIGMPVMQHQLESPVCFNQVMDTSGQQEQDLSVQCAFEDSCLIFYEDTTLEEVLLPPSVLSAPAAAPVCK